MSVVTFDYDTWIARYPEFQNIGAKLAGLYFNEATLHVDNNGSSVITDAGQLELLLMMATAHIAQLNSGSTDLEKSPLVGRINNASEGSVSVQTDSQYPPGSAQWWQQTQYGASFWAATSRFRSFQYYGGPTRNQDPYFPGSGIH